MARPWKKRSAWPYVAKSGRKSYAVGFYDHERRERSRTFPTAGHARAWMHDYVSAERRGNESLRRFLLDLDAKEANGTDARTIGEVLELFFALDADPRNEGGVAPVTFERYRSVADRHILGKGSRTPRGDRLPPHRHAMDVASVPAARFNEPQAPRAWREQMLHAGVAPSTRLHAWRVMSAALSWAARSQAVPEIQTNGCILANERISSRRRSVRRGGTGYAPRGRRRTALLPSWALSPQAVEAIREQLLAPVEGRDPIFGLRDAVIVSLQYGLCARSQEVWAMRWKSLHQSFAEIVEAISYGQLDEWGKTERSAQRRTAIPGILVEDLDEWRAALRRWGHPAGDVDFIIPGDLHGAGHGRRDLRTGACHLTRSQAKRWGWQRFKPAVTRAAGQPEFSDILGATPYALRRGGISVRLRAEDAQTVANECGTSLQMLSAHYAFAIDDLRRFGPRPVNVEWRAARVARTGRRQRKRRVRFASDQDVVGRARRKFFFAWFSSRRRASRAS